jgi:hypothetical protein
MTTPIALTLMLTLLGVARVAAAQAPPTQDEPPRPTTPGVTGSIGLDGTIDTFEKQTRRAVVKTADGVRHVFHLTKKTAVHGANAAAADVSAGLDAGSHVVVQYVREGGKSTAVEVDRVGEGGLQAVHGSVTHVDRGARTLAVRLADGSAMTLHLTERAAKEAGNDVRRADKVVVFYADERGKRVAHYFKKVV